MVFQAREFTFEALDMPSKPREMTSRAWGIPFRAGRVGALRGTSVLRAVSQSVSARTRATRFRNCSARVCPTKCRTMKKLLLIPALFALSSGISSAAIIVPVLLSPAPGNTDLANSSGQGVANMTNNSGLSIPLNGGETLAAASAATHVLSGTGHQQSWLTLDGGAGGDYFNGGTPISFIWDLGSDVVLDNTLVWQYGNDGGGATNRGNHLKDFTLRYNTAAQGSATFSGAASSFLMPADTNTTGQSAAQVFANGGVTARYVRLDLMDNYFGTAPMTAGGSRVGIGELRFDGAPVPEPSSALLALGGVMGLALRRRK